MFGSALRSEFQVVSMTAYRHGRSTAGQKIDHNEIVLIVSGTDDTFHAAKAAAFF
jgi:hypothetical protein